MRKQVAYDVRLFALLILLPRGLNLLVVSVRRGSRVSAKWCGKILELRVLLYVCVPPEYILHFTAATRSFLTIACAVLCQEK